MPLIDVPPLEASLDIAAPPARVWDLVGDPRRLHRWSPQNVGTLLVGRLGEGARMVNLNRRGWVLWPTTARVVRYRPGRELAFRISENHTVWSWHVEPLGSGSRVTVRREAPEGLSDLSVKLTESAFGKVDRFHRELQRGMVASLERVRDAAETDRVGG